MSLLASILAHFDESVTFQTVVFISAVVYSTNAHTTRVVFRWGY